MYFLRFTLSARFCHGAVEFTMLATAVWLTAIKASWRVPSLLSPQALNKSLSTVDELLFTQYYYKQNYGNTTWMTHMHVFNMNAVDIKKTQNSANGLKNEFEDVNTVHIKICAQAGRLQSRECTEHYSTLWFYSEGERETAWKVALYFKGLMRQLCLKS